MFNDKINSSIAEAVKKCMGEELKGDQHKIDANKNNKIDAHDFKLLRAKKKVEEEVELTLEETQELVENGNEDLDRLISAHQKKLDKLQPGTAKHKEYTNHVNDLKLAKKSGWEAVWKKRGMSFGKANFQKLNKEEVEQIDEKKYEPAEYNAAAAAARKKREENEERRREARENGEDKPTVRKVAGKAYGGAAQKDDEDMNEEVVMEEEIELSEDQLDESKMDSSVEKATWAHERGDWRQRDYHIRDAIKKTKNKKFANAMHQAYAMNDIGDWRGKDHYLKVADSHATKPKHKNFIDKFKQMTSEEVEQIDEVLDTPERAVKYGLKAQSSLASSLAKGDKKTVQKRAKGLLNLNAKMTRKAAEEMDEEVEQIDEVSLGTSPDKLRARTAIQNSGKFPRKGQTDFRNIPGINHPKASDETKEYGERVRANKNEVLKKAIKSAAGTHGPKGKLPEGTVSFSDLIESYKEGGIKSLFKKIEEEVDNETFTKEFKDQKDKFDGKKKGADVAAPASQGVVDVKEETHTEVQVVDMTDGSQKPEITTIDLEEKTLTSGETAEKERIVKSMKKNLPSFKERYGERAKSVMYATATKIAKEKQ